MKNEETIALLKNLIPLSNLGNLQESKIKKIRERISFLSAIDWYNCLFAAKFNILFILYFNPSLK